MSFASMPCALISPTIRLDGEGVVTRGGGGLWPFGVNAERDYRGIGDDFRARDAVRRDVWHLLGMRYIQWRSNGEWKRGDENEPGKRKT